MKMLERLIAKRTGPAANLPTTHPGQNTVLESPARFRVVNAGRRWRKSSTSLIALVSAAAAKSNGLYFWIWPSYPMGQTGFGMLRHACAGWEVSEGRRRVKAPNGAEIWIKSADNPQSLRGFGLDGAVLDECRDISPKLWPEVVRPALSDRRGWAIFNSTPRGYDWFYTLYQFAKDHGPEWDGWTFTTHDNPEIDRGELASIEAQTPSLVWRQEYLADFGAGAELGVFRNVRAVAVLVAGDKEQPELDPGGPERHHDHHIVSGLDFAQVADFTVHSIGCVTCRKQLQIDRFNRTEWATARSRVRTAWEKWGIRTILAEQNSIGGPNIEALQAEGLPVIPFVTTAASKPPLIQSYALAIEKAEWALLHDEQQIWELEAYQMTPSRVTGRPTYSAPDGGHDDIVIGGALMNQAAHMDAADSYGTNPVGDWRG
jgi:hypothetical protein